MATLFPRTSADAAPDSPSPPPSAHPAPSPRRHPLCARHSSPSASALLPVGRSLLWQTVDVILHRFETRNSFSRGPRQPSVFPPLVFYSPPPPFWGRQTARAVDVPTNEPPSPRVCPSSHQNQPSPRLLAWFACLAAFNAVIDTSSRDPLPLPLLRCHSSTSS
ncbi:hypothetical protein BJY59DRAFT_699623 [Rhodotorula toruloides]